MDAQCGMIHIGPKVDTVHISINWWINIQHGGISISKNSMWPIRWNEALTHVTMGMNLENTRSEKKLVTQKAKYSLSPLM